MHTERSRWRHATPWILLLVGLLGAVYAFSGAMMGASFTVSSVSLGQSAHWRMIAIRYEWITALFLLLTVVAALVLLRRRSQAA